MSSTFYKPEYIIENNTSMEGDNIYLMYKVSIYKWAHVNDNMKICHYNYICAWTYTCTFTNHMSHFNNYAVI